MTQRTRHLHIQLFRQRLSHKSVNRELKHERFWGTDGNRKWAIFTLTCPHTTTFTLLSVFSPLEISSINIWETIRSWHAKCSLPVAVRVSKTRELKLPNVRHRKIQHNLPAQSAKALVKLLPQFCWIICILRVSFFYLFLSAKTEHTPLGLKFVWNQLLWGVTSLE